MSQKIALILKRGIDWKSCQSISSNLVKSYEAQDCVIKHYEIPMYSEFPADFIATSKRLCADSPDIISFVDHGEAPYMLISHYLLHSNNQETEFIFHIYGDFTYFLNSWARCLELLKGRKVKLVCASQAQAETVKSITELNDVMTIPFSVDQDDFFYSRELREEFRKKHNLNVKDKVIVYTGRISLQKNVVYLVECFNDFCKKFGEENTYLYIAGPCDDIGMPYLGKNLLVNFYRSKFLESISGCEKIKYLGVLNSKDLNELYNGSDIYCSLSTHNDEDFGMAPAEAFSTGVLGILSKWGGYKSYLSTSTDILPVDVDIQHDSIDIQISQYYKAMMRQLDLLESDENRASRAQLMSQNYGLKTSVESIKELIELKTPVLPSLSDKIVRYAEKSKNGNLFSKPVFSDEYQDIYKGKYD
ncbi:glycosyltransferase family 4 protein [Bacteriovorax sp. DB6_IX]|uniref:glycosyltransferase family 4 protein n=1 Tax=Bacteriovorax sp. DB6_IX TaxID=1353530 RepID=UPI00038A03D7|nr:glycosyltransferase family 4 protein [Bacteriovorax sp. DB6_IX]EQC52203.1 glycosyltransferase, group 1 family protein [Bacteriovorax sp. DB6_IX]